MCVSTYRLSSSGRRKHMAPHDATAAAISRRPPGKRLNGGARCLARGGGRGLHAAAGAPLLEPDAVVEELPGLRRGHRLVAEGVERYPLPKVGGRREEGVALAEHGLEPSRADATTYIIELLFCQLRPCTV